MTRREWLAQAASWAAFAALARRGDAQVISGNAPVRGTARACVFVYLNGAPSQLDTFDVNDAGWNAADADIQQHGNIALSNRLFPKLSTLTDDMCILRSVQSWEAIHDRGVFYMQTAHPSNPAFLAETPHMGAIIAHELGGAGPMPPFLSLNQQGGRFRGSTFLGGSVAPLAAPTEGDGLSVIRHDYFGDESEERFFERYDLLARLDTRLRSDPFDPVMGDHAAYYESARLMMFDEGIASVFRIDEAERDRYGDTSLGRAAQVARNAIRAKNGTVFLALTHSGWDTHQRMWDTNNNPNMYSLSNELDSAIGSLVEDLKTSGDFDQTLIVMMGEFGRTPGELNLQGGRDHHRDAMSVAMIGGGIAGNRVIGATDARGAFVTDPGWSDNRTIRTEDIAATVYSALGIDWTKSIQDTPSGRKFEYVPFALSGRYTSVDEVFR